MKGLDLSNLPKDPETSQKIIERTFESNNIDKKLGKLGLFFGLGESVKMNIAGLTIIILLFSGISYTFGILFLDFSANKNVIGILEFWGIITPLITLVLGFIFGKSQNN